MSDNHILTNDIGNLRGLSTDSIFVRPSNVADIAINIQKAPDRTLQLRRGYQCQIAHIGGMGCGTFDDPVKEEIHTITIGTDGFVYNKLTKQIYFYYDGQVTGTITGVSNTNPANVTSALNGLVAGTNLIIRDIEGMLNINNKQYIINPTDANHFDLYSTTNTKAITFAAQTNPCALTIPAHGLLTGAKIMVDKVKGMVNLNNQAYTITLIDANTLSLNGVDATGFPAYISGGVIYKSVDATAFPAYTSGGTWSIAFADQRYLIFTIFTDPRFLVTNPGWSVQAWSITPWGAPSGESITCNITAMRAAQIDGNQNNVNTFVVEFGHELAASNVIQFNDVNGILQQRTVISVTATSITFDGTPVSVLDGAYVNQFFDIPFRKGFDVASPYLISIFIATITDPITGIFGLQIAINGDSNYPAAFLQIIEPVIIDSNRTFIIDYWYWDMINFTTTFPLPPLPGSAIIAFQNSPLFENASTEVFDDVIYIANGIDFPQKYDSQTVYRAGMPVGARPTVDDNITAPIQPFVPGDTYEYATTYEQIDNLDHLIEGELSPITDYAVAAMAGTTASNVTVTNIGANTGWNTNGALAEADTATVYGPDINGFYYDVVSLIPGFTLKIGDSAYYLDTTAAQINGNQGPTFTIIVNAGHVINPGDTVYFPDSTGTVLFFRNIVSTTPISIEISGTPVTVTGGTFIQSYKVSKVFGDVAIVNGNQTNTNVINVKVGHSIQASIDIVEFTDASNNLQRRNVTAIAAGSITIDGPAVSINNLFLITSINQRSDALNFQMPNFAPITLTDSSPISNNLRINIYRTDQGVPFIPGRQIFLVASIPNDSIGPPKQTYIDELTDAELGAILDQDPDFLPNPPPISKYLKSFGNQMFYGGGARNNPDNSDRVFFSEGNSPESVPLATNSFVTPNNVDDVSGLGIAGTSLIITKETSLWAASGSFLTGQIEVVQIAPGSNIGCVAHATIASVGTLMYFLHTNGVYAITENQLFPTDPFGDPIPLSLPIDNLFRETAYLPQNKFVFKRAVACNYTKDKQYLLFLPCEDIQSTIRTANMNSTLLCYDYKEKNWFPWINMNAAGGMFVIDDDLYFQERRFSGVDGNTANLYKQHRFYRLIDHADHASPQRAEWRSSWEYLKYPRVRKKFSKCVLLMDRLSALFQYNNPQLFFSTYLNQIPNLQDTMAQVTMVDNIRNSAWSYSPWGWNNWSGYQDSFVAINLRQGTVAKSIQIGFTVQGINMDIRLAGFQLEAIPENRRSMIR